MAYLIDFQPNSRGGHGTAILREGDRALDVEELTITSAKQRGDLLDRSILVDLPVIPEARRLEESKLWAEFRQARPTILGALLDAASAALRQRAHCLVDRVGAGA